MKKTIKLFGFIALVTVIGFSMIACGSPGNGGLSPKDIDLDDIGFDAEDIYGSNANVPSAPSDEDEAEEVFMTIYPTLRTSYSYLQGEITDYAEEVLWNAQQAAGQSGSLNLNQTKSVAEIVTGYTNRGISHLSGNVTINGSGNQTSGGYSVTIKLSYDYDSDEDSYSYGTDRVYFKVNAEVSNSESGNQTSATYSESIKLSYAGVFALDDYCGKGASNFNFSTTATYTQQNQNPTPTVNAGGNVTFYDLNDTQTFTRTLTEEEVIDIFTYF